MGSDGRQMGQIGGQPRGQQRWGGSGGLWECCVACLAGLASAGLLQPAAPPGVNTDLEGAWAVGMAFLRRPGLSVARCPRRCTLHSALCMPCASCACPAWSLRAHLSTAQISRQPANSGPLARWPTASSPAAGWRRSCSVGAPAGCSEHVHVIAAKSRQYCSSSSSLLAVAALLQTGRRVRCAPGQ